MGVFLMYQHIANLTIVPVSYLYFGDINGNLMKHKDAAYTLSKLIS